MKEVYCPFVSFKQLIKRGVLKVDYMRGATCWSSNSLYNICRCSIIVSRSCIRHFIICFVSSIFNVFFASWLEALTLGLMGVVLYFSTSALWYVITILLVLLMAREVFQVNNQGEIHKGLTPGLRFTKCCTKIWSPFNFMFWRYIVNSPLLGLPPFT